jgi:hypothetical protein
MTIVTILCMSYLHFRTDVVAQTGTDSDIANFRGQILAFFAAIETQPSNLSTIQNAYQKILVAGQQTQDTEFLLTMVEKTDVMLKVGTRWTPEFLDSKSVGTDLIQIRYLYKCDTQPFVWYFTFYRTQTRPNDPPTSTRSWNCIGIRFDNDLDSLFKGILPK